MVPELEPEHQHDAEYWYQCLESYAAAKSMHTWRLRNGYSAEDAQGVCYETFDLGVTLNPTDTMYVRLTDENNPENDCALAWVFSRSTQPVYIQYGGTRVPSTSPSGGLITKSTHYCKTFEPVVTWAKECIDAGA